MHKSISFFILGALISLVLTTTLRLVTLKEHDVHYHANWGIFIDGQQLDLNQDVYKEEITSCSDIEGEMVRPEKRVHLHENKGEVVHVHQPGVTWGHLLSNMGFTLGQNILVDDKGQIYQDSNGKKLIFILNGKEIFSPYNVLIESEDKLLISYGEQSVDDLKNTAYNEIDANAHDYNTKNDPASCSGDHETFFDKLLRAFIN